MANKPYSVPSRLCGHEVKVHQYADYLEVYYKDHLVERLEQARGERKARIDYRHIIWSLVRKPGAFARYRFKEHLFPTPVFRLAYEAVGTADGRMWSTSESCTWQPAPWRLGWSGPSPGSCWLENPLTTRRYRSWRRQHHPRYPNSGPSAPRT